MTQPIIRRVPSTKPAPQPEPEPVASHRFLVRVPFGLHEPNPNRVVHVDPLHLRQVYTPKIMGTDQTTSVTGPDLTFAWVAGHGMGSDYHDPARIVAAATRAARRGGGLLPGAWVGEFELAVHPAHPKILRITDVLARVDLRYATMIMRLHAWATSHVPGVPKLLKTQAASIIQLLARKSEYQQLELAFANPALGEHWLGQHHARITEFFDTYHAWARGEPITDEDEPESPDSIPLVGDYARQRIMGTDT